MQVFVPYPSPLDVAKCLDSRRLHKQILECKQIIDAIDGRSSAWANHPVVMMYRPYRTWLAMYKWCLMAFMEGDLSSAVVASREASGWEPPCLTRDFDFCDQHKRRLYTKSPDLYPEWAYLGTSKENWYFVDGELVKYVGGKRI